MIVTLCGSTRFKEEYQAIERGLALEGHLVFTVSWYKGMEIEDSVKEVLDVVHSEKIFRCDEIAVINVGGYIGDSTRKEILLAQQLGKPIHYLELYNEKPFPRSMNECMVARWLRAGAIENLDPAAEALAEEILKSESDPHIAMNVFNHAFIEGDRVEVRNRRDGKDPYLGVVGGMAYIIGKDEHGSIGEGSHLWAIGLRDGTPVVRIDGISTPVCVDEVYPIPDRRLGAEKPEFKNVDGIIYAEIPDLPEDKPKVAPEFDPVEIAIGAFNNLIKVGDTVGVINRRSGGDGSLKFFADIEEKAFPVFLNMHAPAGSETFERGIRDGMPVIRLKGHPFPICIDEIYPIPAPTEEPTEEMIDQALDDLSPPKPPDDFDDPLRKGLT